MSEQTNSLPSEQTNSLPKEYLGHHQGQENLAAKVAQLLQEVGGPLLEKVKAETKKLIQERELREKFESDRKQEHDRNHKTLMEILEEARKKLEATKKDMESLFS